MNFFITLFHISWFWSQVQALQLATPWIRTQFPPVQLLDSQQVCLLTVGIFKNSQLFKNTLHFQFVYIDPKKPYWGSGQLILLYVHIKGRTYRFCILVSFSDHEKSEPFSKRSSLPLVGLWLGISLVVLLCLSGILWITLRFSRKRR